MKKILLTAAITASLFSVNTFAAASASQGMLVWDGLVTGAVLGSDIGITGANGGTLTNGTIQYNATNGTFTSLMPIVVEAHALALGVVDPATLFATDITWTLVNATVTDSANYSDGVNLVFNINGVDVPYVAGTVLTDVSPVLQVQVQDSTGPLDPTAVPAGLFQVSGTITAGSGL